MAPHRQPCSLLRLSLNSVSQMIDLACTSIFLEHGGFQFGECASEVEALQEYLITNLPLTLFEILGSDRNLANRQYQNAFFWIKDPRIKLALFMHPSITAFR